MDIGISIVSLFASLISYIMVDYVWKYTFAKRFKSKTITSTMYGKQLSQLTSSLTKASKEVDRVLTELSLVASNREDAVQKLEVNLASLEQKEIDLKNRIQTLEKLPIPVADHFAKLIEAGEKGSARRDYLLFGAGVAVSTLIAIVLKLAGWG